MEHSESSEALDYLGKGMVSKWARIVGWLALLVFSFHSCTHMIGAGDTWVAMACGRHFVNHGVDTVEPFSHTSVDAGPTEEEIAQWPGWAKRITHMVGFETVKKWHPTGWIGQNWLSHIFLFKLATTLGSEEEPYLDAIIFCKFAVYLIVTICVYHICRILGASFFLAVFFSCFAAFISRSFIGIRPQSFTNMFVVVYLLVLVLTSYKNARYIWLIVPLVVIWANSHGGYIYAFIMLVPFVGWHLLMHLPKRWLIAVYCILTWSVLCFLAHRFLKHEVLHALPLYLDWVIYLWLVTLAASLGMTVHKKVSNGVLIVLHGIISGILFLILFLRFLPTIPPDLSASGRLMLQDYAADARWMHLVISVLAAILGVIVFSLKDRVVRVIDMRGIAHVITAGVVAFVVMLILNPFHLTNVSHTLVISVSQDAQRWRDVVEWRGAFDWDNRYGTAVPFLVMFILAWVCLVVWAVTLIYTARTLSSRTKQKTGNVTEFIWPKMDLVLFVIVGMTILMAIQARRFIPIAGFATCPIIAVLIHQSTYCIAAILNHKRTERLEPSPIPIKLKTITVAISTVVVLVLGVFWSLKFKRIYLDPWPADPLRHSMFMRMTGSNVKPFEACEFIRQNKLSGNMLNHWTEGGFIAWGQTPDPQTGETPLKLFMDGRGQRAYSREILDCWATIMDGGPICRKARWAGRELTAQEFGEAQKWITDELQKYNIWVVHMPAAEFDTALVHALETNPDWRVVFMDSKHRLFVNIKTVEGKTLYNNMFIGKVVYPDKYRADLAMGYNLLLFQSKSRRRVGLDLIARGFRRDPSPILMQILLQAAKFSPELGPKVDQVCTDYVAEFRKSKMQYIDENGYSLRLDAAHLALIRLEQIARAQGNTEAAEAYKAQQGDYVEELKRISRRMAW